MNATPREGNPPALDAAMRLHGDGRLPDALAAYDAFLRRDPGHAGALQMSAIVLFQLERVDESVERIGRALAADPDFVDAWVNAGVIYGAAGRPVDAVRALERAVALEPTLVEAWSNLASQRLGLEDAIGAEQAARRALADGRYGGAAINLAMALLAQGRRQDALVALEPYSSTLAPDIAGVRAQTLIALGRHAEARRELDVALAANDDATLRLERARLAEAQLDLETSASDYQALLALGYEYDAIRELALSELVFQRKSFALWNDLGMLQRAFRERVHAAAAAPGSMTGLTPFSFLSDPSTRAEQRALASAHSRVYRFIPFPKRPLSSGRLRIGYLSADLAEHATGVLAVGLFEQHDRERFEVFAYSTGPDDGSALRKRLVAAFDQFVHAEGWSAGRIARRIRDDDIDILVDLKGYTANAPTAVVAMRPAPIVVSYLGYPGTSGATFVDYLIGDRVVTPLAHAPDYSETLVQLPHSYQINDDRRTIAEPPTRASLGLPEDAVVLCCFNSTYKINLDVIDAWVAILQGVPDAVLWMLGRGYDGGTAERLKAIIVGRGIDASRIVFAATRPHAEYLALYKRADLFLDTWPYNAHTTASDALWAGCPIITLQGDTFAGRVAASLLGALGITNGIAPDRTNYIATAIAWASDRARLAAMRTLVEERRVAMPLFDTKATTRAIEAAYIAMARQHADGRRTPILIAADGTVTG
jgi:predicted O-linked N-acetylglucosamine transferase (SPINDLY family)